MATKVDIPFENKSSVTLPGTVEKIIPSKYREPEKAEISVEGADPLYREVRIENTLQDDKGNDVKLKPGAQVEVTIEADADAISPKKPVESDEDQEEPEAEAAGGSH